MLASFVPVSLGFAVVVRRDSVSATHRSTSLTMLAHHGAMICYDFGRLDERPVWSKIGFVQENPRTSLAT